MKKAISIAVAVAIILVTGVVAGCIGIKKPAGPVEKATLGVESSYLGI